MMDAARKEAPAAVREHDVALAKDWKDELFWVISLRENKRIKILLRKSDKGSPALLLSCINI